MGGAKLADKLRDFRLLDVRHDASSRFAVSSGQKLVKLVFGRVAGLHGFTRIPSRRCYNMDRRFRLQSSSPNEPSGKDVPCPAAAPRTVNYGPRAGAVGTNEEWQDVVLQHRFLTEGVVLYWSRTYMLLAKCMAISGEEILLVVRELIRSEEAAHSSDAPVLHERDPLIDLGL